MILQRQSRDLARRGDGRISTHGRLPAVNDLLSGGVEMVGQPGETHRRSLAVPGPDTPGFPNVSKPTTPGAIRQAWWPWKLASLTRGWSLPILKPGRDADDADAGTAA
jgi:hypothetical protein